MVFYIFIIEDLISCTINAVINKNFMYLGISVVLVFQTLTILVESVKHYHQQDFTL